MAEICPICEKEVHPSYRDEVDGVATVSGGATERDIDPLLTH